MIIFQSSKSFSGQTLASSNTGTVVDLREARSFAVQPIATGSSILGSVQLQASSDGGVTFGNYGASISLPGGNNIPVNYSDQGIGHVRAVFTAAAGVGSLDVVISSKSEE